MMTSIDFPGAYLDDCKIVENVGYTTDSVVADRLWKLGEELVNQKFDIP